MAEKVTSLNSGHTVKMTVDARNQLRTAFGGGVERDWLVDPVLDTERPVFIGAVDRGWRVIGVLHQPIDPPRRL